jgi:hypothetical protein
VGCGWEGEKEGTQKDGCDDEEKASSSISWFHCAFCLTSWQQREGGGREAAVVAVDNGRVEWTTNIGLIGLEMDEEIKRYL